MGSEMCIRDRLGAVCGVNARLGSLWRARAKAWAVSFVELRHLLHHCCHSYSAPRGSSAASTATRRLGGPASGVSIQCTFTEVHTRFTPGSHHVHTSSQKVHRKFTLFAESSHLSQKVHTFHRKKKYTPFCGKLSNAATSFTCVHPVLITVASSCGSGRD